MTHDLQLLEALVIDNPDLDRLETMLAQFNIFEALGAVRQELRHSDFLAFLLNPQQSHGLGDLFVKRLLQRAIAGAEQNPPGLTRLDLDLWDLSELEVRREWRNIDLLLLNETHQLAVIIENKIDSGEHSHQLQRYRRLVQQAFPGWHTVGILLTPAGATPTDSAYLTLNYCHHLRPDRQTAPGPPINAGARHRHPDGPLFPDDPETYRDRIRNRRPLPAYLPQTPARPRPHLRTPARPPG
jgi:hypothetical protein